MDFTFWATLGLALPLLSYLYISSNDSKLQRLPPEAALASPDRWTDDDVKRAAHELSGTPASLLEGKLPPRTGRRYIVVGGVRATTSMIRLGVYDSLTHICIKHRQVF